jgi:hypothetical protein
MALLDARSSTRSRLSVNCSTPFPITQNRGRERYLIETVRAAAFVQHGAFAGGLEPTFEYVTDPVSRWIAFKRNPPGAVDQCTTTFITVGTFARVQAGLR